MKKGKNSFNLPTRDDDMPGLNLYNKNINGVDMALVDVTTSFYLDRPVYDDKMLKELREGFAKVWNDVTAKY